MTKLNEEEVLKEASTEEKREFLRVWAAEKADGNPAHVPVIREAKVAVTEKFGVGLGTDIITNELRQLRLEIIRASAVPTAAAAALGRLSALAEITAIMQREGIQSISIDEDGMPIEFKRFPKQN